jgi:lambda family phage portal protein
VRRAGRQLNLARRGWEALLDLFQKGGAGRSDFAGAQMGRLTFDWDARNKPPDEELKSELRSLRARARHLSRNDGFSKRFLTLHGANILSDEGPQLESQVVGPDGEPDERARKEIERGWAEWCHSRVTVGPPMNFYQANRLALRTAAIDGEIFCRPAINTPKNPHRFGLGFIDADRVDEWLNRPPSPREPEIRLGAEVDEDGDPVVWHVRRWQTEGLAIPGEHVRVPAAEIIHPYFPLRLNQTRGTTLFHAVMLHAHHSRGMTEAELVNSRTSASKMGFFQTQKDADVVISDKSKRPPRMNADPGTIPVLEPGWEFKEFAPDHPSAQFANFMKLMLQGLASGVDVFYSALANDPAGVNYSSMRSFLQIDQRVWRAAQLHWISEFMDPIFERWLETALLARALDLPSIDHRRYLAHEFHPPGWDWVDPESEVKADALAFHQVQTSLTEIVTKRGITLEKLLQRRQRDRELLEKYGESEPSLVANVSEPSNRAVRDGERPKGDMNDRPGAGDSEDGEDAEPAYAGGARSRLSTQSRRRPALNGNANGAGRR